jgi:hypothetical protein
MTDNEKMIEEARRWPAGAGPIPSAAPGNLITRLADALEAAEKANVKLDRDLGREIDRVEELHGVADRLSWAIASIEIIGEHSSGNNPWENAIEYAEAHVWEAPQGETSDAQVERARIIADLREWARPLGNSPEEDTLRLVIERIERAAVTEQGENR